MWCLSAWGYQKLHLTYLGKKDCEVCFTAKYPNGKFWRFQIGANLKRYNKIRNTKQTQKTHLVSDEFNDNSVSGVPTALKTNIKRSIKWQNHVKYLGSNFDHWFLFDLENNIACDN